MEQKEIIEIAKKALDEKGWSWKKPIIVRKLKKYVLFGPVMWKVWTNSNKKGRDVFILIDDKNGRILNISMTPEEIHR